jgi:hypothetical protein
MNKQKFTAISLLIVMSYLLFPKEMVHELLHEHQNTCTSIVTNEGCPSQVSSIHDHCLLLDLGSPVFEPISFLYISPLLAAEINSYFLTTFEIELIYLFHFSSRGPPTA